MIPTLSQVCCLSSAFDADIENFAAGQCRSVEIWLTKLEDYLQRHSVSEVREWLDRFEMAAPVASYQGGVLASQGEQRKEAWELLARRLDRCRELEIGTLVVACDVPPPLTPETIGRVQMSLRQVAQEAGKQNVRAALEFQATSVLGNNLQTAAALVAEVASPHLGLCLDAFHFCVGPSKLADLGYLTADNLFHVQLCDLADTPRELARDSQRILPGDGDLPLVPIIERLRQIDYRGPVSLELLNPQLWQVPARQLGDIGMTALRKVLGQASMHPGGLAQRGMP
jgi:sugar phosphate isomerase/epimerase